MKREGFHKYKDLILAWAAGAAIQFLDEDGNWEDIDAPSWLLTYEYRIKPSEPRVWYIPLYKSGGVGILRSEKDYQQRKDPYYDAPDFDRWIRVVEDTSFVPDKPGT